MADFRIETYKIFNIMKRQEYNALSDDDKDYLKVLLSCTVIDLSDGSKAKTFLWSIFAGNTQTGQHLRDTANGFIMIPNEPTP